MVSIIILTKNEEVDLPGCLKAITWSDDIHVLDSLSTDRTLEIAKQFGAKIYTHPFESFGKQRNFALDYADLKYDWVLFLDADEVATDAFKQNVLEQIKNAGDNIAGFYCCWKMMLEDRWLKRCDNFPKWQLRLLKKGRVRFTDFGHGQKEDQVIGELAYIREPYLHYCFSKGWTYWLQKHNDYATKEAIARANNRPPFKNVWSRHGSKRNPALKSWLSRMPGWPVLRFIMMYFLKLGFIEGTPGLIYSVNIAYYEFLIQVKMRELARAGKLNTDAAKPAADPLSAKPVVVNNKSEVAPQPQF